MDKPKCAKCGKVQDETRFRFFEIVWRCDCIINQTLWCGLLCQNCADSFPDKIERPGGRIG